MAPREPWLSIVMPVWNGERYLPEALESVRREGTDGYEVIAVDDGSSDGSPERVGAVAALAAHRARPRRQLGGGDQRRPARGPRQVRLLPAPGRPLVSRSAGRDPAGSRVRACPGPAPRALRRARWKSPRALAVPAACGRGGSGPVRRTPDRAELHRRSRPGVRPGSRPARGRHGRVALVHGRLGL